jgi:hypothetical protein
MMALWPQGAMSNREHLPMQPAQTAALDPSSDCSSAERQRHQLLEGNHPMLALSELGNPLPQPSGSLRPIVVR